VGAPSRRGDASAQTGPFVGVDVGAQSLYCVSLDEHLRAAGTAVFRADEIQEFGAWVSTARVVAIDAPAQLSTAPHRDDQPQELKPKFAAARCAEIALARDHGIRRLPEAGHLSFAAEQEDRRGHSSARLCASCGRCCEREPAHVVARRARCAACRPRRAQP
jgi:hypothetical protein